jgi:lysyl-tRNA synthetase class 2
MPSATKETLVARARLIQKIRSFFEGRDILEVSTPVLGKTTTTDMQIDSFKTDDYFLQTSPEFYLKRLLAADLGAIYQLGPVFRRGEEGKKHQPEFTLLEWYRPGFLLADLIQEVSDLLVNILNCPPIKCFSYQAVFEELLDCQPHLASIEVLNALAVKHQVISLKDALSLNLDKDACLDLLMASFIEPKLSQLYSGPMAITHYPASQSAYAQTEKIIDSKGHEFFVAQRFEAYFGGLELANGYFELLDATKLREKCILDNLKRTQIGLAAIPLDENLLAAQEAGMPLCSGVALGVDRLIMLALNKATIQEVVAFDADRY